MGNIINTSQFLSNKDLYRLTVIVNKKLVTDSVSINKILATELIKIKSSRRTMQLENCFYKVISELPEGCFIKDFDVMFNPDYKVDVMRVLINTYKKHSFSIIWPGEYKDETLVYSEESLLDYKTYAIKDYDIFCVI